MLTYQGFITRNRDKSFVAYVSLFLTLEFRNS